MFDEQLSNIIIFKNFYRKYAYENGEKVANGEKMKNCDLWKILFKK